MEVTMYAVYDKLAETYARPFTMDKKVAFRNFKFMAKESKEEEVTDKEIREIGTFDSETGELKAVYPVAVFDMEKSWKELQNENS